MLQRQAQEVIPSILQDHSREGSGLSIQLDRMEEILGLDLSQDIDQNLFCLLLLIRPLSQ